MRKQKNKEYTSSIGKAEKTKQTKGILRLGTWNIRSINGKEEKLSHSLRRQSLHYIRNGLLEKDLHCVMNGKKHVASWSHITKLYEIDLKQGLFYSQCNKLFDEHVLPQKE